jgi:integrase
MVHSTRGDRGNLEIDITLPEPIGRYRLSSGTKKATVRERRVGIIRQLWEDGQLAELRALKAGDLSWAELEQARKQKRLGSGTLLADTRLRRALWTSIDEMMPRMGRSDLTRARYQASIETLKRLAPPPLGAHATVGDLLRVDWSAFAAAWPTSPANWNRMRTAVSRFLTRLLNDKWHPFRRALIHEDVFAPLREDSESFELSAKDFWRLYGAVSEPVRPALLLLAVTGMRVGEYLNDEALEVREEGAVLRVKGKTGVHEYAVPEDYRAEVLSAVPCRLARLSKQPKRIEYDARYKRIYREVRAAADRLKIRTTVHALRHLYAQLGTDALGESRVQDALGHEDSRVTRGYTKRRARGEVARAVAKGLKAAKRPRRKEA